MSYNFSMEALEIRTIYTTSEPYTEVSVVELATRNHTSNVSNMWAHALDKPIKELNYLHGYEISDDLFWAERRMARHPQVYAAMNPANGWGDSTSARYILMTLMDWCFKWPNATLRISY